MDNFMIAFILLLGSILIAQFVNEKAIKNLDQLKKAELTDLFSKNRIYTMVILICIITIFFISLRFQLIDPFISTIVYIIAIFCFLVINGYLSYKKLKENAFPDSYIKSYLLSTTIRFLGLVIFVWLIKFE